MNRDCEVIILNGIKLKQGKRNFFKVVDIKA